MGGIHLNPRVRIKAVMHRKNPIYYALHMPWENIWMSAPIYELLKRPDELFVVEHAHLQPRFVEDSVRIAVKELLDTHADLADPPTYSTVRAMLRYLEDKGITIVRGVLRKEARAVLDRYAASGEIYNG